MDNPCSVRLGERIGDLHSRTQGLRVEDSLHSNDFFEGRPAAYSMTMKSTPASERISWTVTMLGWFSALAAFAS